jgi:hypothetical protein
VVCHFFALVCHCHFSKAFPPFFIAKTSVTRFISRQNYLSRHFRIFFRPPELMWKMGAFWGSNRLFWVFPGSAKGTSQ